MKRCVVCDRKTSGEYCSLHEAAYKNVVQTYEKWKSSKDIGWKEYLRSVKENPNSGSWVIEVCGHLLSREEKIVRRESE